MHKSLQQIVQFMLTIYAIMNILCIICKGITVVYVYIKCAMKKNLSYYVLLWLICLSTAVAIVLAYPYVENKGRLADQYHHARSQMFVFTQTKGNDIFIADHGMRIGG
jgi:hypothetical protein